MKMSRLEQSKTTGTHAKDEKKRHKILEPVVKESYEINFWSAYNLFSLFSL